MVLVNCTRGANVSRVWINTTLFDHNCAARENYICNAVIIRGGVAEIVETDKARGWGVGIRRRCRDAQKRKNAHAHHRHVQRNITLASQQRLPVRIRLHGKKYPSGQWKSVWCIRYKVPEQIFSRECVAAQFSARAEVATLAAFTRSYPCRWVGMVDIVERGTSGLRVAGAGELRLSAVSRYLKHKHMSHYMRLFGSAERETAKGRVKRR